MLPSALVSNITEHSNVQLMAKPCEHTHPTKSTATGLPIFAAKYRDYAIAMLKCSDYSKTIASIRAAFQIPTSISDSRIRLSSRFHEFGEFPVELTADVWDEIVPVLKIVEISTNPRPLAPLVVPESVEPRRIPNEIEHPSQNQISTTIHLIGGPVDLSIPISDTCTLSELKTIISQRETRLPNRLIFHHQEVQLLDDTKPLQEYGIIDQSVITMMTNAEVYVTTPERSKVPMRITLYADVSSLKLLIYNLLDIPMHRQILMCVGEELVDATRLGSYHQVSHNSQITVDVMPAGPGTVTIHPLLHVEVKSAWATDDDDDDGNSFYVLPTSTVLDLKVLIHNLDLISPSRQRLEFRGKTLDDEQNMNEAQVESGSRLIMHVTSQKT